MTAAVGSPADLRPAPFDPRRPRILPENPATDLASHVLVHGRPRRLSGRDLVAELDAAGLRGRGGAGFPTALKVRAVATNARTRRSRPPVVVANGTEGEPASAKDRTLLVVSPHLVLDGMVTAGVAVGAPRAVLCVDQTDRVGLSAARVAVSERGGRDPLQLEVVPTPSRYITGEESALVSYLNGGDARPTFTGYRPAERGVGGAPTLVDNIETLANLAIIARHGSAAWRAVGDPDEPGTMLTTVRGAVDQPGVYEVPVGTPIGSLVGRTARHGAGVLVGGYFGSWLSPSEALSAPLSRAGLGPFGASPGCGLVAVMPRHHCPLQEVEAVLGWLASSSAGQCGVCVNGLPALSAAFSELVQGDREGEASYRLDRWSPMVVGRGACKLPDGAVRFLDTARSVFADHIEQHARRGPCPQNREAILPTPPIGPWR